jgi:hypothetical protein
VHLVWAAAATTHWAAAASAHGRAPLARAYPRAARGPPSLLPPPFNPPPGHSNPECAFLHPLPLGIPWHRPRKGGRHAGRPQGRRDDGKGWAEGGGAGFCRGRRQACPDWRLGSGTPSRVAHRHGMPCCLSDGFLAGNAAGSRPRDTPPPLAPPGVHALLQDSPQGLLDLLSSPPPARARAGACLRVAAPCLAPAFSLACLRASRLAE